MNRMKTMPPVFQEKLVCPECKKEKVPIEQGRVKQHVIDLGIGVGICGRFNPEPLVITVVR